MPDLTSYAPFLVVVGVVYLAACWITFQKAGQPGWAAIIPIYNVVVMLRMVERPWWWLLLMLVPFANVAFVLIFVFDLARAFGQSMLFGIGLLLLPPVFFPILAFGGSRYVGVD